LVEGVWVVYVAITVHTFPLTVLLLAITVFRCAHSFTCCHYSSHVSPYSFATCHDCFPVHSQFHVLPLLFTRFPLQFCYLPSQFSGALTVSRVAMTVHTFHLTVSLLAITVFRCTHSFTCCHDSSHISPYSFATCHHSFPVHSQFRVLP